MEDGTWFSHLIPGFTPGALGIWFFGFVLVSGQVLKWVSEWRAWRKLPADEQQANREGFTAQVTLLQHQLTASDGENRRTRAEITSLRAEYDRYRTKCHEDYDRLRRQFADYRLLCEHETGQLRDSLIDALNRMTGHRRRDAAQQVAEIRRRADAEMPPHIRDAAARVAGYLQQAEDEDNAP